MLKLPSNDRKFLSSYMVQAKKMAMMELARKTIISACFAMIFFISSIIALFIGSPIDVPFEASILFTFFLILNAPMAEKKTKKDDLLPCWINFDFITSAAWFIASVLMHVTMVMRAELPLFDYYYQSVHPAFSLILMSLAFGFKNVSNRFAGKIKAFEGADVKIDFIIL